MMRGTSVPLVLHDRAAVAPKRRYGAPRRRNGRATGVSILNNLGELAKPKLATPEEWAWSASPGALLA